MKPVDEFTAWDRRGEDYRRAGDAVRARANQAYAERNIGRGHALMSVAEDYYRVERRFRWPRGRSWI